MKKLSVSMKSELWENLDSKVWIDKYNNVWDIGLLFIGGCFLGEIFLPYRQNILLLIWQLFFIFLFVLKTISYQKYIRRRKE